MDEEPARIRLVASDDMPLSAARKLKARPMSTTAILYGNYFSNRDGRPDQADCEHDAFVFFDLDSSSTAGPAIVSSASASLMQRDESQFL